MAAPLVPIVAQLYPIVLQQHHQERLYFHWKDTDDLYIFKNSWTQNALQMRGTFRQIHCTAADLKLEGKLQDKLDIGFKIKYLKN